MKTVFPSHNLVIWPVVGTEAGFPVRRVFCVGKNYADHVAEMGGDSARSEPIFFTKDASCLVQDGTEIIYPPHTSDLHHEVELVVAMGPHGIWGHAVGLDMTRRDLQAQAKAKGQPWDRAKSFAQSAPMGMIVPGTVSTKAEIILRVNGELRQSSVLSKMIWSVEEIVERLRTDMGLSAGDVIFTGTPAGVAAVGPGDVLEAQISGLPGLSVSYTK